MEDVLQKAIDAEHLQESIELIHTWDEFVSKHIDLEIIDFMISTTETIYDEFSIIYDVSEQYSAVKFSKYMLEILNNMKNKIE